MALSQEDIDALIGSLMPEEGETDSAQVAKTRLRVYDFGRPDKFSKDHIRGAQLLFDGFARQLSSRFSALLRMAAHAEVSSVDQVTYQEFVEGLPNPCSVAVVSWSDLPSTMLFNMGLKVLLPALDRMCGGQGGTPDVSRSLTEIELAMSKRMAQDISDIVSSTLGEFNIHHSLNVMALETNPLFVQQAMAPNDMVLWVSVSVKLGSETGFFEFCLPYILLQPILPAFSANRWFSRGVGQEKGETESVQEALEEVEIPISCRLGTTLLSMEELLSVRKGDVLELNTPKDGLASLYVFGKPKFKAKVGTVGNRLAAKIVALAEEHEGDPI